MEEFMKTTFITMPILAMGLFVTLSAQADVKTICEQKIGTNSLLESEKIECLKLKTEKDANAFILNISNERLVKAEKTAADKKAADEKAKTETDNKTPAATVTDSSKESTLSLDGKDYNVKYDKSDNNKIQATVTEATSCTSCSVVVRRFNITDGNLSDIQALNKSLEKELASVLKEPKTRGTARADLADDEDARDTEDDSVGQKKLNALHDKCEDLGSEKNKALNCYIKGLNDIFKLKKDERPSEQELVNFYGNYMEQELVAALNKEHQDQDGRYLMSGIRSTPEFSNKVAELLRRIPSRYGGLHREVLASVELSVAQITADRQRTYATTQFENDPYRRQAGLNQFVVDRNAIINRTYMQDRSIFNALSQSELFREKPFEARSMYDSYMNDMARFRSQLTTQGGEFNPFSLMISRTQSNDPWMQQFPSLDAQRSLLSNPFTQQQQIPQQQTQFNQQGQSMMNPGLPALPPLSSLPGLSLSNQTLTTQSTSQPSIMNVPNAGLRGGGRMQ